MSGYRYIRRTHSTLRQLRKLRELEDEFKIQDTATLVSAYNEARATHEHYDAFSTWIEKYISFFKEKTSSECHRDAMEFAQLASIVPKSPNEKRLLEDIFNALCHKIRFGDNRDGKLLEALSYFLLAVDCRAFARNSYSLVDMARDVINKLGSNQTFSKSTYSAHGTSLIALYHICAFIHMVDPTEFDHDKSDGLYQQINRCLQNIIDSQSYYPFYYHATLAQQSLARMDFRPSISPNEIRFRSIRALRGCVHAFVILWGALWCLFDCYGIEKLIEDCTAAWTSRRIKKKSWFDYAQGLLVSRMRVNNDPEAIIAFEECFSRLEEIEDEMSDKGNQRALRFTMIHEATRLALMCPSQSARQWASDKMYYFGKYCTRGKGWAQDLVVLEALVEAVLELGMHVQFRSNMFKALKAIRFHVGASKLTEIVDYWESRRQRNEERNEASASTDRSECDSLFSKIKKEMLLNEALPTRCSTKNMLKKHYQQKSKVPSLFENEPSRHANTLDHSLLLYEKVFAPNGEIQVVKSPILLEDVFKNRQHSRRTFSKPVKRVLLFGNPGTGKTTLAKKIAYKWSVDEWGDTFDMLYLIPVRELSSNTYDDSTTRKQRNLETAITNICFPGECAETYEVLKLKVQEDLDKESTVVIFDGLDSGELITKEMILETSWKCCCVMVLSRPQDLHNETKLANVEVECMGLNDEQLVRFIRTETSSTRLVECVKSHSSVWDILHIPIVANTLTFLHKTQKEYVNCEKSSFNMSLLYWNVSDQIWASYTKKVGHHLRRNVIFEALEEIAFRALEDGQVLIGQHLVSKYSQDPQTKDTLEDSGFLLLKRESVYYQFPHLSFQEFFAGQYIAHSMMSEDDGRKKKAVEFLKENKYCANFKQVFCFMIQALTLENREKGYLEVESIIDDGPIAIGYQQHLRLSIELLEASLSASRPEERERMVASTKMLDIALDWIGSRECHSDALRTTMLASATNSHIERFYGSSISGTTEEFASLFVQIARAAKYFPDQWEKVINTLKTDLAVKGGTKGLSCIVPLIRAIPEEQHSLLELYWEYINHDDEILSNALSYLPDIVRLVLSYAEQFFERCKSILLNDSGDLKGGELYLDFPRLAQLMPDRWQEILQMVKQACLNDGAFEAFGLDLLGRFVDYVPESGGQVMELFRESSVSDNQSKKSIARSCLSLIKAMPENSTEIVEILWTLCEDEDDDVYNVARGQLVQVMLSWGEKTDSAINTLISLSESQPHSTCSSLVRLAAIAYKLVGETPEGVDLLISSLGQVDLNAIWEQLVLCIRDSIGTKMEKEMELHWLHFMILKALELPEVEHQELCMMIYNIESDPHKAAVMSAKLMSIPQSPCRQFVAPIILGKLTICCPDYEENLFNCIDELAQDEDEDVASEACVHMFSILEKLPHLAQKIVKRLRECLQHFECLHFVRMRESVSLESLFEAYMGCRDDFLIFWIVWKSFDTPVTMETRRNEKTEMIVQTTPNSKKRHNFQTTEEAMAFASSFDECIEIVFPDAASRVPTLDLQERQPRRQSFFASLLERGLGKKRFFKSLRERLTSSD